MMARRLQIALARAYTDAAARQELYRGQTAAFAELGLSTDELASLAEFARANEPRLELYAGILVKKKGKPLQKRLPVLYDVLQSAESDGWARMCAEFYDMTPPSEGDAPASQAEAFVAHVASRAGSFGRHTELVSEVARYELAKLSLAGVAAPATQARAAAPATQARAGCPLVPGPFIVETFAYDLLGVKAPTVAGGTSFTPCTTTILFCRHVETGAVVVLRMTDALARIVARCDGRSTLEEIAERAGVKGRLLVAAVAKALSGLEAHGVVAKTAEGRHDHA